MTEPVDFTTAYRDELQLLVSANRAKALPPPPGPIGLALSGGGIRSATFCLGVLQALAARRKLASFDYLSTVSGGGYIGAWLSAWIYRENLEKVQEALGTFGSGSGVNPKAIEPEQVSWLRRYSNYLAPKVGLLSTDSLTLVTTWLRNVALNLIVIIAFLAALLLVPRLALPLVAFLAPTYHDALGWAAAWLGMVILPAAMLSNFLHMERPSKESQFWMVTARGVILTVLLPGTLAGIFASLWLFGIQTLPASIGRGFVVRSLVLLALIWVGWIMIELWRIRKLEREARAKRLWNVVKAAGIYALASSVAVGAAGGLLEYARNQIEFDGSTHDLAALLTFGPAAFLVVFGIAGSIFVGLVGRVYFERAREWWSRMNAGFLAVAVGWLILTSSAFYVPAIAEWSYASAGPWLKGLLGAGWLASLLSTLLAPKGNSLSKPMQNNMMGVLNAAAIVFMLGFIIAVATLTDWALTSAGAIERTQVEQSKEVSKLDLRVSSKDKNIDARVDVQVDKAVTLEAFIDARLCDLYWLLNLRGPASLPFMWSAFVVTLLVLLIFGWRVDVNKFSLHNMYKNRLIRCYLGASNLQRSAQPFTGFDDRDDFPLANLGADVKQPPEWRHGQRPFHILNTTLNISQGKNLAWQERKGASFVLTPFYSGFALAKTQGETTGNKTRWALAELSSQRSAPDSLANLSEPEPGYRPTRQYAAQEQEDHGFSLGMAMATSGAAATTQMGPATRPALAFVLTLFNVRIGRWSPNPARDKWKRASPRFGLACLLQELFGFSTEESSFVYLSDGGHFDNLGVYELVRRRCKVIWVVDAAEDVKRSFSDLGRMIRQCRIDFGVEINLDLSVMKPVKEGKLPYEGYAAGTIHYGLGREDGKIIYIKPTLCEGAREPIDLLNYAAKNPSFPQQTTADQFFDESQFESYRRLGLHIGECCSHAHDRTLPAAAPDASSQRTQGPENRGPHPLAWWFGWLLAGTVAGFLVLGAYEWLVMPKASQASMFIEKPCELLSYATDAKVDCRNIVLGIEPAPATSQAPAAAHPWLEELRPTAPGIFLGIDNVLVVTYTAMFIVGFLLIRARVFPADTARGRKAFLWCTAILALAGAFFDYGENFQLLAGLGAPAKTIAQIALAVRPWTALKVGIFLLNAALLVGLYLWSRLHPVKEKQ